MMQRGRTIASPVKVTAIIDTGATWSAFTPDVFEQLDLSPYDEATVSTSDGRHGARDLYDVDLEFRSDGKVHHVEKIAAISSALSGCAVEGLIGRNLLSHAVFWYDGRRHQYSLTFG